MNINFPTIKVLMIPSSILALVFSMFVFSIKYFLPKIQSQLKVVSSTQKEIQSLESRVEILKTFSTDALSNKSDITYIVLPDSNPAAIVLSQIKRSLLNNKSVLTEVDFTGGSVSGTDIKKTELSFSFSSEKTESAIKALTDLKTLAPLSIINEVNFDNTQGASEVDVKLSIYWSELPKTLPDLTVPISGLTEEQKLTMEKVLSFQLPELSPNSQVVESEGRVNPFN